MTKKSTKPRKVYECTVWDSEGPAVVIEGATLRATYFDDGSGEFGLLIRGEEFLGREDAKLKNHIKEIEDYIKTVQKQVTICKTALKTLKKIKL